MTGVQAVITDGVTLFDLVALDPETFHVEATWSPPLHNDTLSVQYMELKLDDDALLVTTSKGKVFVVHREDTGDKPKFTLTRSIDLVKESILDTSARLLNGMFDSKGNIWWTTGSILPTDSAAVVDAVVGFITPDGGIAHTVLKNQNVENGIAVSNDTVFVATGPAGTAAQHDAEGYMYAFSSLPPPPESYQPLVEVRWRSVYPAGSRLKPGGFARGSGATPTLLGNSFVALTDNADVQVSILVYPQQPSHVSSLTSPSILNDHVASVCSVPLFTPNASAVDIAGLAHIDEHGNSGVLFVNTFNGPPFTVGNGPGGVNGAWNNMSAQDSGITRVDVVPHPSNSSGPSSVSCTTRWTLPLRMKSVPVLSLGTGLVYGYTQDEDLAIKGRWVWYVVAIDWDSGKEVWRVRTGAGGLWNDDYLPAAMGSDGTFYQVSLLLLLLCALECRKRDEREKKMETRGLNWKR